MDPEAAVVDWLLDSDPALRWRVERDLLDAPGSTWQRTRARVATEGFGARMLALQDPDGQWAGGAFFPVDATPEEEGQPWTATTWSLKALRDWGVDAAALGDTAQRIAANCRWEYDDLPYWGGEVDVCINAWTLCNGAWLGVDVSGLAVWFVEHQLPDGGWNCEWVEGSTRSSFHSTLNAVHGLLDYQVRTGDDSVRPARQRGEEYLLQRRLLYRKSTGEPVAEWVTRLSFPMRWSYNALRALDHFVDSTATDGTSPDPRIADAVESVRSARSAEGTWIREHHPPGREWFDIDSPVGRPSKWLTYHAMRVLRWADAA